MISRVSIFFIFLGSVFLTSGKFVDPQTAIKFYFTVLSVLVGTLALTLTHTNLRRDVQKLTSLSVIKGFYLVAVLQAIYGILQYYGIFSTNHYAFAITGSFENPAGLIAVLSLLFPIGVYWCINSKNLEQGFVFISVGIIFITIILSGSRTGILGSVISALLIIAVEFKLFPKISNIKHSKLLFVSVLILLLFGSFTLYKLKEGSANGRLLIWRVSAEIIKDKPILGSGFKGFQGHYMDYQAQYFKNNPDSEFSQLADNVIHPFNEFINVAVNYGMIGLICYVALLGSILWKIIKSKSSLQIILLAVFATFIVLSCLSYPLQYAPVGFLLGYFVLVLFSNSIPPEKLYLRERLTITGFCMVGIVFFSQRLLHEVEWKTIAVKSLQGQTEQMLSQYQKLYPHLKYNAFFLYNYGAELNVAKEYKKSITILDECEKRLNDYDLQLLLADNYYNIGDTAKAIQKCQYAANMIPCRFLPLYWQFEAYKAGGRTNESIKIAQEIVGKEVKVESNIVTTIIGKANLYLSNRKNE